MTLVSFSSACFQKGYHSDFEIQKFENIKFYDGSSKVDLGTDISNLDSELMETPLLLKQDRKVIFSNSKWILDIQFPINK